MSPSLFKAVSLFHANMSLRNLYILPITKIKRTYFKQVQFYLNFEKAHPNTFTVKPGKQSKGKETAKSIKNRKSYMAGKEKKKKNENVTKDTCYTEI